MPFRSWPVVAPWLPPSGSNVFMSFAWRGRLKHRAVALPLTIFISWLSALPEYSLAAPANRIGSFAYTAAELKVIQEAITSTVFIAFSVFSLGKPLKMSTIAGFLLIAASLGVVFLNR